MQRIAMRKKGRMVTVSRQPKLVSTERKKSRQPQPRLIDGTTLKKMLASPGLLYVGGVLLLAAIAGAIVIMMSDETYGPHAHSHDGHSYEDH